MLRPWLGIFRRRCSGRLVPERLECRGRACSGAAPSPVTSAAEWRGCDSGAGAALEIRARASSGAGQLPNKQLVLRSQAQAGGSEAPSPVFAPRLERQDNRKHPPNLFQASSTCPGGPRRAGIPPYCNSSERGTPLTYAHPFSKSYYYPNGFVPSISPHPGIETKESHTECDPTLRRSPPPARSRGSQLPETDAPVRALKDRGQPPESCVATPTFQSCL